MRRPSLAAVLGVGLVGLGTLAAIAAAKTPKAEVVRPAQELRWTALPGSPGVRISQLWGDFEQGPYGALIKIPGGARRAPHEPRADLKVVVIQGTVRHTNERGRERRLGPGSYLHVPAGARHTRGCAPGPDCLWLQQQGGAHDARAATKVTGRSR